MKSLFWLLGLFALAVALSLAAHNPGYVLLVYPPYRIEMSLSLFVVGLLALFVFGYLAVRLTSAALNLPTYVRKFRTERTDARKRQVMMEALNAFFEGRYATAEKAAVQAMELGEDSGFNPIIAARAAHELRAFDRRDAHLAAAKSKTASESTKLYMAAAKFNLDQRRPQKALESLQSLREAGVSIPIGALHLELKAQQQIGNWDAVLELVKHLEKREAIDPVYASQLFQQAWLEKIQTPDQDSPTLKSVWRSVPDEYKHHARIASAAALAFIQVEDCRNAQKVLADSLNTQWDADLVKQYGDCLGSGVIEQIEQAERWLKQHSEDAGLLLVLGKLCLHQGLWGKARSYLDASISLSPGHTAYTLLGQLAEKLQQPEEAIKYSQKAMELTSRTKAGEREILLRDRI